MDGDFDGFGVSIFCKDERLVCFMSFLLKDEVMAGKDY